MKKYLLIMSLLLGAIRCFAAQFTLESPAFQPNTMIPAQFSCNGANQSPPLLWYNVPANTQSLALVVNDPDAPDGVWTHWILFNIAPTMTKLDLGAGSPAGSSNAKNSWGKAYYQGPCSPIGAHRYAFDLYALDKVLDLNNGVDKDAALNAMTGHVIGTAELVGLYQK